MAWFVVALRFVCTSVLLTSSMPDLRRGIAENASQRKICLLHSTAGMQVLSVTRASLLCENVSHNNERALMRSLLHALIFLILSFFAAVLGRMCRKSLASSVISFVWLRRSVFACACTSNNEVCGVWICCASGRVYAVALLLLHFTTICANTLTTHSTHTATTHLACTTKQARKQ